MQTHLTAMQRIREFFQAYPKIMGQDLEWQDDWRRMTLGKSVDSLAAANSPESDRNSASGQPDRIILDDGETSLQRVKTMQCDNEPVTAISPKTQGSINEQKSSIGDEVKSGEYFLSSPS
jgi:hypothetical protein